MNNRIKEMIEEIGLLQDQDLYVIAEAVIRECARIDREMNNPDHKEGAYNHTILEHFG